MTTPARADEVRLTPHSRSPRPNLYPDRKPSVCPAEDARHDIHYERRLYPQAGGQSPFLPTPGFRPCFVVDLHHTNKTHEHNFLFHMSISESADYRELSCRPEHHMAWENRNEREVVSRGPLPADLFMHLL